MSPPVFDISADGRQIVFHGRAGRSNNLFLYDMEARVLRQLTHSGDEQLQPRFSPDGRSVVCSAGKPGFGASGHLNPRHIYVLDLQDDSVRQVTSDDSHWDYWPAFSSDGTRIVFDGAVPETAFSYPSDVYVVDLEGTQRGDCRRLTYGKYNSMLRPRFWRADSAILFTAYTNNDDQLGSYLASVSTDGSLEIPEPITPFGATTHTGEALAENRILLISDLDRSLDYRVCIFDSATKEFDVLTKYRSGPMFPRFVDGRIYWLELALFCVDLNQRPTGRPAEVVPAKVFSDPMAWIQKQVRGK